MSKIAKVDAIPLEIPYDHGGPPAGWGEQAWQKLSILMARVETEDGLVGWGEAFSYNCRRAVQAALETMIVPVVIGRDSRDIAGLSRDMQQSLHLFGRYGITIFALSALDIALWDISAKRAGLPLHACLGGAVRTRIPGYASLLKYRDPELVGAKVAKAREEGYDAIKIHETEVDEVRAAREAAGSGIPLMVDTNCPWTPEQARLMASRLREFDLHWLEEPIFPPEDFAALARLGRESGIPIAAGENACTSFEFAKMFDAGAVQYAQPSVTKVGGVTELRKVATLAEAAGVALMPHSPYFGPGFLATIQLAAADPVDCLLERFYCDLEASLYGDLIDTVSGEFRVPDGPGLGCEPDPDVIKEYGVSDG
jgi:L-alanine-DL-glutamate epimerase-like enolase superfamily enzyme